MAETMLERCGAIEMVIGLPNPVTFGEAFSRIARKQGAESMLAIRKLA